MDAKEREILFHNLREVHPRWPVRFVSGYIHGLEDEDRHKRPARAFLEGAQALDHYALGYLVSFAVHRGPDSELEPWFSLIGLIVKECRDEAQGP